MSCGVTQIDDTRAKFDLGSLYKYKVVHYRVNDAEWKDPSSISALFAMQQTGKILKLIDDFTASGPSHLPKWVGSLFVQTADNRQYVVIAVNSSSKVLAKNAVYAGAMTVLNSTAPQKSDAALEAQLRCDQATLDFLVDRKEERSELDYYSNLVGTEDTSLESYVRWTLRRTIAELEAQFDKKTSQWAGIQTYIDEHQLLMEKVKVDKAIYQLEVLTIEEKFMLKFVVNGKMSATMLTPNSKEIYDIHVALMSQEQRNRLTHAINGNGEVERNFEGLLLAMDFTEFDSAMGDDWCKYVDSFIELCVNDSVDAVAAANHNAEMHALNGNIKPGKEAKAEKVMKKLTKEEKKLIQLEKQKRKAERTTQRKAKSKVIGTTLRTTNRSIIKRPELMKSVKKVASIYARAIALPLNTKPVRWFDMYNTYATGCLSLKNRRKVNISPNSPATSNDLMAPGDILSFHFRSVLAHNIVYQWRETAWLYGVNWIDTAGNYVLTGSTSNFTTAVSDPLVLKTVTATDTKAGGIDGPHGATWYAGARDREEQARMFYLSINQKIDLSGTTSISDVWEVQLCHYSDGELTVVNQDTQTFGPATSTATVVAPYGDYYCIRLRCQDTTNGQHTLTISAINIYSAAGDATTFAHRPMPDVEKIFSQIEESRIVAFAGMISNTAAEAWKNGTVYTTQASGGKNWQDWVSSPSQSISSTANFYSEVAQKGVYAFCKPVGPKDFEFSKEFLRDPSGNIVDSFWDITFSKDYLVLYLSSPDVQGRAVDVSAGGFIEYKSVTQVTAFDVTSMKEADHNLAMEELRSMVNYSANENHITKVFSQIAEYGTQAWRFYKQNKEIIDAAAEAIASFFI